MRSAGTTRALGATLIGLRDLRRRRHDERRARRRARRRAAIGQQVGMADQHLGAAIAQDVGDLLGLEVPVDRHGVGGQPLRRDRGFEEGEIVAQEQRDRIAGVTPRSMKPCAARAARSSSCCFVRRRSPLTRPSMVACVISLPFCTLLRRASPPHENRLLPVCAWNEVGDSRLRPGRGRGGGWTISPGYPTPHPNPPPQGGREHRSPYLTTPPASPATHA